MEDMLECLDLSRDASGRAGMPRAEPVSVDQDRDTSSTAGQPREEPGCLGQSQILSI